HVLICRWHSKALDFSWIDPSTPRDLPRVLQQAAEKEMQAKRAVGILITIRPDVLDQFAFDPPVGLLQDFTSYRLGGCLTLLDLTARKLPVTIEVTCSRPPLDPYAITVYQYGNTDVNGRV